MRKILTNKNCSIIIYLILLFQNPIQNIIPICGYLDEVIPIILCLFASYYLYVKYEKNIFKELLSPKYRYFSISIIVVSLIGVFGNLFFRYQSFIPIVIDALTVFKGFIVYIIIYMLGCEGAFTVSKDQFINISKKIILIFFLLSIINLLIPIFPTGDSRLGIPSQCLFFTHPTYLATAGITLLIVLSFDEKSLKENWIYYIAITCTILLTQRSKAYMFVGVYYLLRVVLINMGRKLNIKILLASLVGALVLGFPKIVTYLSNPHWARTALMSKSINVAIDHLPLGSGFATFGTWYSGVYYSPLYEKYELNNLWGLTIYDYSFLGDTYWPAILGQFGFIGLCVVIYIIYLIYRNIVMESNKYVYFSKLALLAYLLILSTSETSFMSPVAVLLCIILAVKVIE